MNRNSVHVLLLAAGALAAACQKPAAPAASPAAAASPSAMSEEEKTIYALGAMIGQRFVSPMHITDKELEALQRGIKDTYKGGKPEFEIQPYAAKFNEMARTRQAESTAGFRDQAAAEPGAVKSASGLVYKTMTAGTGASPKASDTVKVHYHGTMPDGRVFDSSVQRGEPVEFALNQVIPCWTEGVQKMKVGEKARFVCPPEIAYGAGGTPDGTIPPGATLVFEVELIGIKGR
jgi:FKBP-type peptidyl-prolyl cis-trans isomerase FkpA